MHISQAGFTPIKGGRHLEHARLDLSMNGPAGDRVFALVDLERGRVLRTVENPALLAGIARWKDEVLSVELGGRTVEAVPKPSGRELTLDYWGRAAMVEIVDGPWAEAFSGHLGFEVALTRVRRAGELVYGASVTLVTTGALRLLERKVGHEIDSHRFRATFVIDTDELDPAIEDSWTGRELQLGSARVRVLTGIDRCAVIDLDPATGASGTRLLQTLASYRLPGKAIDFGMYAEVTLPGPVSRDDRVAVLPN